MTLTTKQGKSVGAIAYLVLVVALVLAACTAFAQDPPADGAPALNPAAQGRQSHF